MATEEEALTNCTYLDRTSTLVTINSKEEQEFLINFLIKYNNITENVWIGMKYTNKSYRWTDGTDTNFTNWSEHSVRDGKEECIQMSLTSESLGKWMDENCKRTSLVVCQKKQDINVESLRNIIDGLTKSLEKQKTDLKNELLIELKKELTDVHPALIPIGFLYTQLPNQSSPIELWPKTNWSEVTQQYSGLFFRAEGGGSEPFGRTQSANYSTISSISEASYGSDIIGHSAPWVIHEIKEGWSGWLSRGFVLDNFRLFTTSAENRPRNTAIKIWKRIQ